MLTQQVLHLPANVELAELTPLGNDQVRCPSCKSTFENGAKFCANCGYWLSNTQLTPNTPVSGIVSIFSIPVGLFVAIVIYKVLPKYDFIGFATLYLIVLVIFCAVISGLISSVIALIGPTINSKTNQNLGIIGIIQSILAIAVGCIYLFKR